MGMMKSQKETTPFINITTNAAFPQIHVPDDLNYVEANHIVEMAHPSEKVVLSYCSELSDYTAPVTLFDAKHKLRIFHDSSAQPIVFTAGTDDRLYGLVHVTNLREGWRAVDITPGTNKKAKIIAFDAIETEGTIYIAVAVRGSVTEGNVLYHGTLKKPKLEADKLVLKGIDADALQWELVANNLGSKDITTLTCMYSRFSASLHIAVGTSQNDTHGLSASHYLVNVQNTDTPWHHVPMPATAKQILGLSVGKVLNTKEDAIFTFFEDNSKNRRITANVIIAEENTLKEIDHVYRLLPGTVGEAQDFFVSHNPWKCSDVVVAGTTGIGFYNFEAIDQVPQTVPGLEAISFKQVVCAEYGDSTSSASTINILAVSEKGELYFIEGKRYYHDKSVQFQCSGLPIQVNVRMVAARFSGLLQSSEMCYVSSESATSGSTSTKSNEISHLYRDALTGNWTSAKIAVQAEQKSMQTKAFLTTIKLHNEEGVPVPIGYPVRIFTSSAPVLATIDGRAWGVGPHPVEIVTSNRTGTLLIATPAADVLTAPIFTVTLPKYNMSTKPTLPKYDLFANQRVLWLLKNKAPTTEELKNAKDAKGQPIFDPNSDFSGAASIMASFKDMSMSLEDDGDSYELKKSWSINENGNLEEDAEEEKGWLEKAAHTAGEFLGDVVEFLKVAVKGVVKLGIFAAKGLVKLLIHIGGKPMEFVLTTLGELVKGVLCAVGHLLGSAVKGLLELFGLWPDESFVRDTHEVLSGIVSAMLSTADLFVETNLSTLDMAAEKLAERARTVIKDTRPAQMPDSNARAAKDHPLMKVVGHPLVQALFKYNPIAWIAEAITEEIDISDSVDLPDFGPLIAVFTEILPDLLIKELENLTRFFKDIESKCGKIINNPTKLLEALFDIAGSAFWTLFDGLKEIVLAVYKVLGAALKQFRVLLEYHVKIPFLSKAFEDQTGLPFTLVNVATYFMAFVFCLGREENPADTIRPVLNLLRSLKKEDVDIKRALGWVNGEENNEMENPEQDFQLMMQQQQLTQRSGKLNMQEKKVSDTPSFGLMSGGSDHESLEDLSQFTSAAIGLTRMVLILSEAIIPATDAVHYGSMKDFHAGQGQLHPPPLPQHPFPPENQKRKDLHHLCLTVALLNVIGHVGSFVVTLKHPHSDLRRISWSGASTACSTIAFLLDAFKDSMKVGGADDPLDLKPTVISGISTLASVFQIISEEEQSKTVTGLHYSACGAGGVVAIAIGFRKKQPEIALAVGGIAAFLDFGVTFAITSMEWFTPHHGSIQEAESKKEEAKRLQEKDKLASTSLLQHGEL